MRKVAQERVNDDFKTAISRPGPWHSVIQQCRSQCDELGSKVKFTLGAGTGRVGYRWFGYATKIDLKGSATNSNLLVKYCASGACRNPATSRMIPTQAGRRVTRGESGWPTKMIIPE
jgi:hypothetical protein